MGSFGPPEALEGLGKVAEVFKLTGSFFLGVASPPSVSSFGLPFSFLL